MHESASLPEPVAVPPAFTPPSAERRSPTFKRPASQGSIPPQSLILPHAWSTGTRSWQLPAVNNLGISSPMLPASRPRPLSAIDSARTGTSSAAQARVTGKMLVPLAPAAPGTIKDHPRSDRPPALPPTPPADGDDRIGWNPESGLLLSEAQVNRESKPLTHMDERRDRQATSPSETRDEIGSPRSQRPDAGSPEREMGMAEGEPPAPPTPLAWLADGIEATRK
jgi:hypothetical protein